MLLFYIIINKMKYQISGNEEKYCPGVSSDLKAALHLSIISVGWYQYTGINSHFEPT